MRGRSLIGIVAVACGCGAQPTAAGDAAAEPLEPDSSGSDLGTPDFSPPDSWGIYLTPIEKLLVIDTSTTPATPGSLAYQANELLGDGATRDVTAATRFWLEDPTLGSFTGATFTSAAPLATSWGTTTRVHAEHEGAPAIARLWLLQLRRGGPRHDLLFEIPFHGTTSPARGVLRHRTDPKDPPSSVFVRAVSAPGGPVGVDASRLAGPIRAMDEGDASYGCTPRATVDGDGDGVRETFSDVPPDTQLCFEVVPPKNTTALPKVADPTFYAASVDIVRVASPPTIDHRLVILLVPKRDPSR